METFQCPSLRAEYRDLEYTNQGTAYVFQCPSLRAEYRDLVTYKTDANGVGFNALHFGLSIATRAEQGAVQLQVSMPFTSG